MKNNKQGSKGCQNRFDDQLFHRDVLFPVSLCRMVFSPKTGAVPVEENKRIQILIISCLYHQESQCHQGAVSMCGQSSSEHSFSGWVSWMNSSFSPVAVQLVDWISPVSGQRVI